VKLRFEAIAASEIDITLVKLLRAAPTPNIVEYKAAVLAVVMKVALK